MARIETQDSARSALSIAEKELAPGEKLVWAGRPGARALAKRNLVRMLVGIPIALFGVLVGWGPFGRLLAGTMGNDVSSAAWNFLVLAVTAWFVAGGIWLLGMPLWAAIVASTVTYAITDRRVLIISTFALKRVISYSPHEIETVETQEQGRGSGDIVFRDDKQIVPEGGRLRVSFRIDYYTGFFGVSDVRRVEDAVRDLARKKEPAAI
jgi:hypothetical protein